MQAGMTVAAAASTAAPAEPAVSGLEAAEPAPAMPAETLALSLAADPSSQRPRRAKAGVAKPKLDPSAGVGPPDSLGAQPSGIELPPSHAPPPAAQRQEGQQDEPVMSPVLSPALQAAAVRTYSCGGGTRTASVVVRGDSYACTHPGCVRVFNSLGALHTHMGWHKRKELIAKGAYERTEHHLKVRIQPRAFVVRRAEHAAGATCAGEDGRRRRAGAGHDI